MATKQSTFYRRPLPATQISFRSPDGKKLFTEALATHHMECYFALSEQFHTQAEPAYCGLGTLTMVLNALEIDPGRIWKGPWRWFSEDMLNCCTPLDIVQKQGITFSEFLCLARCNGARVEAYRPDEVTVGSSIGTLEHFRQLVRDITSHDNHRFLVVAYDRQALGQSGSGHFSPIGGYHPERDLVLIMDVARFKYPPHWADLTAVYRAMTGIDPATGRSRGYIVLSRRDDDVAPQLPSFVRVVSGGKQHWKRLAATFCQKLPEIVRSARPKNASEFVRVIVQALPHDVVQSFTTVMEQFPQLQLAPEHSALVQSIVQQLRTTSMFQEVAMATPAGDERQLRYELAALIMLAIPVDELYVQLNTIAGEEGMKELVSKDEVVEKLYTLGEGHEELQREIASVREIVCALADFCFCKGRQLDRRRSDGGCCSKDTVVAETQQTCCGNCMH